MNKVDNEPVIEEMKEDDWVSPEDRRLEEEKARLRAKQDGLRYRGTDGGSSGGGGGNASKSSQRNEMDKGKYWSDDLDSNKEWHAAPGELQLQTCFSDLFLALACYGSMYLLRNKSELGWMGFATIALAAIVGTVRFTGIAHRVAIPVHEALSTVASVTAMPLICLSCFILPTVPEWDVGLLILDAFIVILHIFLPTITKLLGTAAGLASGLIIILQALSVLVAWGPYSWLCGSSLLMGVGIAVIAGEFLKPTRKNYIMWGNLWLGVDAFHFLFGIAVIYLGWGIRFRHHNYFYSLPLQ